MKLDAQVSERIQGLIEKGQAVLVTHEWGQDDLALSPHVEWSTQALVYLTQVFGSAHHYTKHFERRTIGAYTRRLGAEVGLAILRAASEDVKHGYLGNLQQMAAAEVFSDFLDQVDYLLEHGHKAAAATVAGAVLENGLRSLAARSDVAVKERDDLTALNNKLAEKTVYSRLRQQ